jgi:hypothetical protein
MKHWFSTEPGKPNKLGGIPEFIKGIKVELFFVVVGKLNLPTTYEKKGVLY